MDRANPAGRRSPWGPGRADRTEGGSLSLEAGLILPVVAIVAFALLQLVGLGGDALLVQQAAAIGARVAVTTSGERAILEAVNEAVGPGRDVRVGIEPAIRRPGDLVTVRVRLASTFGPFTPVVSGRAVARGEPSLDAR